MSSRLEEGLRARWRLILLVIAAGSLLFRAAYALELWNSPLLLSHRFHGSDMQFFDRWARVIAGGDWWSRQELHPFAPWQRAAATEYLRLYPEERAALVAAGAPAGDEEALGRALWSRWYGGKRLHQEPLYPYLVALTYKLAGPDPRWVFLWQLLLGAATNVLVALAARRAFGELAGATAGLLALFYAPLLSHEMVLLRTTLSAFVITLAVLLLERAFQDGGPRAHLAAGAGLGLALLCQLPMVLVAAAAFAVVAWQARGRWAAVLREGGALAAGLALPLMPVVARNVVTGIAPLTYISVGSQTYLPHAMAGYDPWSGAHAFGLPEIRVMRETGGSFPAVARAAWRTHPGWDARLRFYAAKLAAAVSWHEETDNQSFYYLRLFSPTLCWLPATFAAVGPLAAVGLAAFLLSRSLRGAAVAAAAVTGLLVVVLTIPISRYRAPYLPAMICLAGLGIASLVDAVARRRFAPLAALAVSGGLAALLVLRPLPPGKEVLRPVDWSSPYLYHYGVAAKRAADAGRWDEALDLVNEFLRVMPPNLAELTRKTAPTIREKDLVCFYAEVTTFQALALERTKREGGVPRELAVALARSCVGYGSDFRSGATPR